MRSKLQKRKDNPNSKYWQKRAMELWGGIIHSRKRCEICEILNENHGDRVEAHHLITRNAPECKFDPENGMLLCTWHHKFSPEISAHKSPMQFLMFIEKFFPSKYAYMKTHAVYRPNYERKSAKDWYEILEKAKGF